MNKLIILLIAVIFISCEEKETCIDMSCMLSDYSMVCYSDKEIELLKSPCYNDNTICYCKQLGF